jgi:16S rRNA processing protein RimM
LVAQLQGVVARDQAQALRGSLLWVPRASFPTPAQDEYYWVDLIGCALYTHAQGVSARIGRVEEVLDNGAHAVLKVLRQGVGPLGVQTLVDAKGRPIEILVPFVRAYIDAVDINARRIDSTWLLD